MDRQSHQRRLFTRPDRQGAKPGKPARRSEVPGFAIGSDNFTHQIRPSKYQKQKESQKMAEHTIMILKTGPSECKVWPPYLLVKGGPGGANQPDRVTWLNKTEGDAILDFGNAAVFEEGSKLRSQV